MKRTNFSIVTLLAVAMMFVFASCTKDGVYKPKKKISKIYETVTTDPNPERVLKESWSWDGKLLSRIDYYGGDFLTFKYEKGQLTSFADDENRIEINYDSKGKLIDNAQMYYGNVQTMNFTFQHEKNLLTSYTVEYLPSIADNAKSARLIENLFRFITPEVAETEAALCTKRATNNSKDNVVYKTEFTYDGKNIVKATTNTGETYTYTYTDYKNPFYGLMVEMGIESWSKNAVSTCVKTEANRPDYNYTYTYKADGKIPTQVTENLTWSLTVGSITSTHTETTVTDYEYTK